ncbi:hypothetical protein ANO11243_063390 [Dothideomycetidae sp. 11243]|nr:hypothetical protein ANO11243_063390 [fungal sp. No.11243]
MGRKTGATSCRVAAGATAGGHPTAMRLVWSGPPLSDRRPQHDRNVRYRFNFSASTLECLAGLVPVLSDAFCSALIEEQVVCINAGPIWGKKSPKLRRVKHSTPRRRGVVPRSRAAESRRGARQPNDLAP